MVGEDRRRVVGLPVDDQALLLRRELRRPRADERLGGPGVGTPLRLQSLRGVRGQGRRGRPREWTRVSGRRPWSSRLRPTTACPRRGRCRGRRRRARARRPRRSGRGSNGAARGPVAARPAGTAAPTAGRAEPAAGCAVRADRPTTAWARRPAGRSGAVPAARAGPGCRSVGQKRAPGRQGAAQPRQVASAASMVVMPRPPDRSTATEPSTTGRWRMRSRYTIDRRPPDSPRAAAR